MVASKANTMTEIEFESVVVDLAHMFDWAVASFRPAKTQKGWRTPVKYDGKGYVDLTLVHTTGFIVFSELKRDVGGTFSDDQRVWAERFTVCADAINSSLLDSSPARVRYFHWRPRDADEIANVLSFGRVTSWSLN